MRRANRARGRRKIAIGAATVIAVLGSVAVPHAHSATATPTYLWGRATLSQAWGPPGTGEAISLSNFFPNETVTVTYKTGAKPGAVVLCTTVVSAVGTGSCNANIPSPGKLGSRVIEARGATSFIVGRATFALEPPAPSTFVAVGDDLTAGTRATSEGDQPAESWATGTDSAVRSAATRLQQLSPALSTHNLAHGGAKASDLSAQLSDPAAQAVDFLSVEIGFNDLCTPSIATMTDATTFDTTVKQALASYRAANPNTWMLVTSLPFLNAIWSGLHSSPGVQAVWDATAACPSLLASTNTDADRLAFSNRGLAFNTSLQNACAAITRCKYDGDAVSKSSPSTVSMLSTVDDFHPSVAGQSQIAFLAMHSSWWAPLGGRITATPNPSALGAPQTTRLDDAMPNAYVPECGWADVGGSLSCTYTTTSLYNGPINLLVTMRIPNDTPLQGPSTSILVTDGTEVVTQPLPTSMASAGDSMTQAANVDPCCAGDNPQYSWSTGTDAAVASHYRKLAALQPSITRQNVAVSGARIANLQSELGLIPSDPLGYLTILIGANDVCTPSLATMTDPTVFETTFRNAINAFHAAHPETLILVGSIPNIYQLWSVLHTIPAAVSTWSSVGICQSMLSSTNTETDRQFVLAREKALNGKLAKVCNATPHCKWDKLAGFNFKYTPNDVSTVDYFHPNLTGQNHASAVEWSAGYWGAW